MVADEEQIYYFELSAIHYSTKTLHKMWCGPINVYKIGQRARFVLHYDVKVTVILKSSIKKFKSYKLRENKYMNI